MFSKNFQFRNFSAVQGCASLARPVMATQKEFCICVNNVQQYYLLFSGPALRIGKLGSCLGPPSKRGPQDSITAKQYLIGIELL